jgi:hypothetical protein
MAINGFPASVGFDPTRYSNRQDTCVNSTLTKNTWVEALSVTGKGRLEAIELRWDVGMSDTNKAMGLKITCDDVIIWWGKYKEAGAASATPDIGMVTANKVSSDDVNNSFCVLPVTTYSYLQCQLKPIVGVAIYKDGTEVATTWDGGTPRTAIFDDFIYFKKSLKVEVYTNATTATGATQGHILYGIAL